MKSILIVVIIAFFFLPLSAQKVSYSRMDSLAYDLAYTKFNIGKFKKQMSTGILISSVGILGYIAANSIMQPPLYDLELAVNINYNKDYYADVKSYQNKMMIVRGICAGVSLIGALVSLNSYTWLKRASLTPSQYGVSFTFDLDDDLSSELE